MPTRLIFLGGATLEGKDSILPTPEEIPGGVDLAPGSQNKVEFYFVGPEYNSAHRLMRGEPARHSPTIDEDAKRLRKITRPERVFVSSPFKLPLEIKESPELTIYIAFGARNSYEVMSWLDSYIFEKRHYYCPPLGTKVDIVKLLQTPPPISYDFYSGIKPVGLYPEPDIKSSLEQIMRGCQVMEAYFRAGYNRREVKPGVLIPGWTLNVETDIIKGIIYTYGLFPEAPGECPPIGEGGGDGKYNFDKIPFYEMRESSIYRLQVMETLARVICAFAIEWKFLSPQEFMGWESPIMYANILERVGKFISSTPHLPYT